MVCATPPQGLAQLRGVEQLALQVGQHAPEALQGFSRHPHAKLRQVALQEGAQKILPPCERGGVAGCEVTQREAATQPKRLELRIRPQFSGKQGRQLHIADPPRQRFGRLAQHAARRRPQQKESTGSAMRIDFRSQRRKQARHELHLVEHDESITLRDEEQLRVREHRTIAFAFDVHEQGARMLGRNGAGQRGLADLTRAENRDSGVEGEALANLGGKQAIDHSCILCGYRSVCNHDAEWPSVAVTLSFDVLTTTRLIPMIRSTVFYFRRCQRWKWFFASTAIARSWHCLLPCSRIWVSRRANQ